MGPLEPILKTTGLADAGRVAPVVSISGSSPHPGIPGLTLGAQSSLLNKLMTVWPFAFSQIWCVFILSIIYQTHIKDVLCMGCVTGNISLISNVYLLFQMH